VDLPAPIALGASGEPRLEVEIPSLRHRVEALHHVRSRDVVPVDDPRHLDTAAANRTPLHSESRTASQAGKTTNTSWTNVSTGPLRSPITTNHSASEYSSCAAGECR